MGKLLKGGLILRPLTENPNDKTRFAEFMHQAFEVDEDWRETSFTAWIEELLDTHPLMSLEHIWCVVDPAANGRIASGLFLIPQIWRYEDIEIPVGRPEIVGTHPDYRRRGLVRELFTVMHDYSEKSGDVLQSITGIPYFYRQFGYGFTVDLGARGQIPFTSIPKLGDDDTAKFSLRPATENDIPDLVELDQSETHHALLTVVYDEKLWSYELIGRNPKSIWKLDVQMVVNANGETVGYVVLNNSESAEYSTAIWRWVIGEKSNYVETFADTLRATQAHMQAIDDKVIALDFHNSIHPDLIKLISRRYGMYMRDRMYAWYLRIPDHVKLIQTIAPVLERRLVHSSAHNYTGKLRIGFYEREDLLMTFKVGKIVDVCMTDEKGRTDASFPHDTWLNLVFGANNESEIHHVLPDALNTPEAAVLLDILFPKKKSSIFAVS